MLNTSGQFLDHIALPFRAAVFRLSCDPAEELRLGARSVAVVPAAHTAVMRTRAAACRGAAGAIVTFGTHPMTFVLRLQPGNRQHAREYYDGKEFVHFVFSNWESPFR
jgi:hypothetical protein